MALATAIKVGGSLLGGLLGRKKQSNRVDYVRLRRDAEKAGFNPLTALIHGGAAGYTQTSAPPLQTAGLIMDAANALSDHYKTPDPVAQERERLEQELLKARIDALQGSARSTGVMGSTMAASVPSEDTGNQYGAGRRTSMDGQLRPQAAPGSGRLDLVPMQLVDGSTFNVRRDLMEQAGLKPTDILSGQILEDLVGEMGDTIGGAAWINAAGEQARREGKPGVLSQIGSRLGNILWTPRQPGEVGPVVNETTRQTEQTIIDQRMQGITTFPPLTLELDDPENERRNKKEGKKWQ